MWNISELLNKLNIDPTRLHDLLVYNPHAPMIFSSGIFLWLFAAFILFYLLLQRRTTARLMFVTLFSYYFYYKSSGAYFFLLAIVTVSDFFIARLMARATVQWQRKMWVAASLAINLGLLCYFKYTNFLCDFFASLTGGTFTAMDIFLPVGISFFTFQSLSYTIDVYRKEITPLTNLLDYAFYVSFFPQLVAGPIVRARDFIPQIRRPLFVSREMFGRGIFLIVSGLFKKAVISDYISINFVERIFDNPTLYSGVENLMGVYGYALQIYCDFSGYSDMAIGITLTPADYLTVIATATLASIGTAGVPSVGLITLAMVFDSVGLPVAGIGLIMGIDRILDMARTAVNITGDAVCTTIVAHQDGALDKSVFNKN